jgi:glycosyltransferase involved in cell wall biosynthesis
MKAFELVKQDSPDLSLLLPGKMKDEFKKDFESWLAENSAAKSITAPGFISDEQLKWLYENAEAYVLPALSEGFGLPGLEAMVHGCPLVSSDATCLPEVYGDAAIYFNPEDINDMAEKTKAVLGDKTLQKQLIKNGNEQVKKYSWRRMSEQTLEVYKEVLTDRYLFSDQEPYG